MEENYTFTVIRRNKQIYFISHDVYDWYSYRVYFNTRLCKTFLMTKHSQYVLHRSNCLFCWWMHFSECRLFDSNSNDTLQAIDPDTILNNHSLQCKECDQNSFDKEYKEKHKCAKYI